MCSSDLATSSKISASDINILRGFPRPTKTAFAKMESILSALFRYRPCRTLHVHFPPINLSIAHDPSGQDLISRVKCLSIICMSAKVFTLFTIATTPAKEFADEAQNAIINMAFKSILLTCFKKQILMIVD